MRKQLLFLALLLGLVLCAPVLGDAPQTRPASGLDAQSGSNSEQIKDLQKRLDEAEARSQDASQRVRSVTDAIRQRTGRIEASADLLNQAAGKLDDQLQESNLDYIASKARMDAITRAIEQLSNEAASAAEKDPVVIELQKVAEERQKEHDLAVMNVKSGVIPERDADASAAALAEANAQVALQRAHAAAAAGGDIIAALRKEIIELAIAQQERDARLSVLEKERDGLRGGLDLLDLLTAAQADEQDARQAIAQLKTELGTK